MRHRAAHGLELLAQVRLRQGDLGAAREALQEAWSLSEGAMPGVLVRLSSLARREGDDEAARAYWEEALRLTQAADDVERIDHLGVLGHAARDLGEFAPAREVYAESLALRRKVGNPFQLPQALEDYGVLACLEGHPA